MRGIGMRLGRDTVKVSPTYPMEISMMVNMPTERGRDKYVQ